MHDSNVKVYVNGVENVEYSDQDESLLDGEKVKYDTDRLCDRISLALEPLLNYADQLDSPSSSEELWGIGSVVRALAKNLERSLDKWQGDFEKHMGMPAIRRTSRGALSPGVTVGVEFRNFMKKP